MGARERNEDQEQWLIVNGRLIIENGGALER